MSRVVFFENHFHESHFKEKENWWFYLIKKIQITDSLKTVKMTKKRPQTNHLNLIISPKRIHNNYIINNYSHKLLTHSYKLCIKKWLNLDTTKIFECISWQKTHKVNFWRSETSMQDRKFSSDVFFSLFDCHCFEFFQTKFF